MIIIRVILYSIEAPPQVVVNPRRSDLTRQSCRATTPAPLQIALFPLDCQPVRRRPGVATSGARSKSSRYRHRYRRTRWASVKHMNRLIKVHAGPPHRIGSDDRRRTPSLRRPSASKPRNVTSTSSRNRAEVRRLTVSADRSSEALTVSGTLSSEGDDGIRTIAASHTLYPAASRSSSSTCGQSKRSCSSRTPRSPCHPSHLLASNAS